MSKLGQLADLLARQTGYTVGVMALPREQRSKFFDRANEVLDLLNPEEGWIDWVWTEEKPYPETLDTLVHIKLRSGAHSQTVPATVRYWGGDCSDQTESSWYTPSDDSYVIVAYKVMK